MLLVALLKVKMALPRMVVTLVRVMRRRLRLMNWMVVLLNITCKLLLLLTLKLIIPIIMVCRITTGLYLRITLDMLLKLQLRVVMMKVIPLRHACPMLLRLDV